MSIYEDYCLPFLIDKACGSPQIQEQRKKIVPLAEGRVLEIGMGSALNLPFYDKTKVEFIWGLEPSDGMRKRAADNLSQSPIEVKWLDLPSEEIPLEDNSADTVLLTYTLCSIAGWETALQQMRRVLKPEGKLIFCEHGEAPETSVLKWQNRITPYWKKIGGGCHLNRPIAQYLEQSGFTIEMLEAEYIHGLPRIVGFNYLGVAKPN